MCIIFGAGDDMEIDIIKLKNNIVDIIDIDEELEISEDTYKTTEMLGLDPITVTGDITKNSVDGYELNLNIKGKMILPCSLTLKPVDYPFDINVNGDIEELYEELGEIYKKTQNSIDIFPIIWENILMEIPIKVTSSDLSDMPTSGDGWQLVTEEKSRINPELEKLVRLAKECVVLIIK